jgi:hypothetical protein
VALSQSELESRIREIRAARDSGVLIVGHGDTRTQFRSLAEMNAIIADLEKQLDEATSTTPRKRVSYLEQRCKGL